MEKLAFDNLAKNCQKYNTLFVFFQGENKVECQLGLTPRGIWFIKEKEKKALFGW